MTATLHSAGGPTRRRGAGEEPLGVVLAMTTVIYACCGAARNTQTAGTDWVVSALVAGVVILWASVGWHAGGAEEEVE